MTFQVIKGHIVRSWKHHFLLQLSTLVVLVGSFSVLSIAVLTSKNINGILASWGREIEINVYLKDEIKDSEREILEAWIRRNANIKTSTYVSKDSAAERFRKDMSQYAPLFLNDPSMKNPLPASLELSFSESWTREAKLSDLELLAKSLKDYPGVDEVSYGQAWVENYSSFKRGISAINYSLGLVLIFGIVMIVGNSVRNSVSQRRDEIEVLELVGATPATIQFPFIAEGAFLGFLSGGIALLVTAGVLALLRSTFQSSALVGGASHLLVYYSAIEIGGILILAAGLGIVGSWLCIRGVNSGWAAAHRSNKSGSQ